MKWLVKLLLCIVMFSSTVCSAVCPTFAEVKSAQFEKTLTFFDYWGVGSTRIADDWLVLAFFKRDKANSRELAIKFAQDNITSVQLDLPRIKTGEKGTVCIYTPDDVEFVVGAYKGEIDPFFTFQMILKS